MVEKVQRDVVIHKVELQLSSKNRENVRVEGKEKTPTVHAV